MSISKIGVLDAPVAEILTNLVRRMEPWGVTQTERIRALAENGPVDYGSGSRPLISSVAGAA